MSVACCAIPVASTTPEPYYGRYLASDFSMRWSDEGRSSDLEDRRGDSPGGGFGLPHLGIGGILILLVLSFVFHRNFFALLGGDSVSNAATQSRPDRKSVV